MNLSEWNVPRILARLRRRGETPNLRMRVSNVTRQTVLAGCVEVADRGEKRRKGLLGREQLAPSEGLWIIPCDAVHTIGMCFPIDLVYLDRQHRVKKIKCAVPSWRLSACLSAHSILELAAGAIRNSQTRLGDQLELSPAIALGGSSASSSSTPSSPQHLPVAGILCMRAPACDILLRRIHNNILQHPVLHTWPSRL
jgi:uncharacterized membrane protein (UPF0127 family)